MRLDGVRFYAGPMASESSRILRLRADRTAGENWLQIDDSGAGEVLFTATNGSASLSPGQVGGLTTMLLNWLAANAKLPEDTARLVRLAEFVSDQVGADPYEYPDLNDPENSPMGLVSKFLTIEGPMRVPDQGLTSVFDDGGVVSPGESVMTDTSEQVVGSPDDLRRQGFNL